MYLIEVDRVLRPGGYWILSGPPINWETHWKGWQRTKEDLAEEQEAIESLARSLCWKKVIQKGNLAIWQKPWNHIDCIKTRRVFKTPPMCKSESGRDGDTAWYTKMETCITPLPDATDRKEVSGGALSKWPARLSAIPPRILLGTLPGITSSTFTDDTETWRKRVDYYKSSLVPTLGVNGRYRNIMDMNAGFGGFAATLEKDRDNVWVMNVVPTIAKHNTLGVIYERGLIGTYQDWYNIVDWIILKYFTIFLYNFIDYLRLWYHVGARHSRLIHEHMILFMLTPFSGCTKTGNSRCH